MDKQLTNIILYFQQYLTWMINRAPDKGVGVEDKSKTVFLISQQKHML